MVTMSIVAAIRDTAALSLVSSYFLLADKLLL